MAYLLDANVFMQAKNLHYGLDFCPAFWDWLIARNTEDLLFSIERVEAEIQAGDDDFVGRMTRTPRGRYVWITTNMAMRLVLTALGTKHAPVQERGWERPPSPRP